MKNKKLNEGFEYISDKYLDIVEEEKYIVRRSVWIKWGVKAACLSLVAILTYVNSSLLLPKSKDLGNEQSRDPINNQQVDIDKNHYNGFNDLYVDVSDLLVASQGKEELLVMKKVEISGGKYQAFYSKVDSVSSEELNKSKGKNIEGLVNTFYVLGHNDLQYIIKKSNDGKYELFKFESFKNDEYPYSDVLNLIYGVNSAKDIVSIQVEPANMDNSDAGKRAQDEIGAFTINNKEDIKRIYEIISTMTCYGEDNWDMIDYGSNDSSMVKSVQQGRYLTLNLTNKSNIDNLKYTGISGMFYEYGGIAYNRLNDKDKGVIEGIFGIRN